MSTLSPLLTAVMLILVSMVPRGPGLPGPRGSVRMAVGTVSVQEPQDPSRVLNLLDGLIERAQESSPLLAAIIRFLAIIVYLVLNIKAWGPWVLIAALLMIGLLVWKGRRTKTQSPPVEEELETEPEL